MITFRGVCVAIFAGLMLAGRAAAVPAPPLPADPNDIRNIEARAKGGSVDDQYRAARYYDTYHDGKAPDEYTAMTWYKMAAGNNNAAAQARYAELDAKLQQFLKDRAAALTGDPAAALVYADGLATLYGQFDATTAAINWYGRAAAAGLARAQERMGEAQLTAYKWHAGGYPAPQFEGDTLSTDPGSAIAWFEKAAAQGDTAAISWLGPLYGLAGPDHDAAKARHWLELAAPDDAEDEGWLCQLEDAGHVFDYLDNWHGDATLIDLAGEPDPEAAFACYTRRLARGDETAQDARFHLAELYYVGRGVAKDDRKAADLFIAFNALSDESREYDGFAQADLARIYVASRTVPHDYVKAYRLFTAAIDSFQGDQAGCSNIMPDKVDQARLDRIATGLTAVFDDREKLIGKMSAGQRKAAGITEGGPPPVMPIINMFCD